jgi:hypothetical protein
VGDTSEESKGQPVHLASLQMPHLSPVTFPTVKKKLSELSAIGSTTGSTCAMMQTLSDVRRRIGWISQQRGADLPLEQVHDSAARLINREQTGKAKQYWLVEGDAMHHLKVNVAWRSLRSGPAWSGRWRDIASCTTQRRRWWRSTKRRRRRRGRSAT